MRGGVIVLVVVSLAACVRSSSTQCGDQVCPSGTQCSVYRDRTLCVLPEQTSACEELKDGARCSTSFDGTCYGGACLPIGCGNGQIDDALYETGEQCDDDNVLGHDGCSSTCRVESPTWEEVSNAQLLLICGHAMAGDASGGTAMMFGGLTYGIAGTWELCGETWRLRSPALSPTKRTGHAVAEDGRRHRTVMFGGRAENIVLGDTWEWNGHSWQRHLVADPPAPRADHALAYDSVRGVTVMFGGRSSGGTLLDDTWEWDGIRWTERDDLALHPSARADHLLAYDPARAVVVLVAESGGAVETWEYDGLAYRNVTPAGGSPPATAGAAMSYDAIERRIVLYGGLAAPIVTWVWDGTSWTSRAATPSPDGRISGAATTDPSTGRMLWASGMIGGQACMEEGGSPAARTWRTSASGWTEVGPALHAQPKARAAHAAALDVHRGKIVMFGGRITTMPIVREGITWELGESGWVDRMPTIAPSPRERAVMVYDAARREVVLFGGVDEPLTWVWNGSIWIARETPVRPPGCTGHAMVYDAHRKVVVLFGGTPCGGSPSNNETWEWNGVAWSKRQVSGPSPSARADHALGYDPIRKLTILFGGTPFSRRPVADTWAWDGTRWTELQASTIPDARSSHGLVWDAARQRLVMVGGLFDVWEWDGADWIAVPGVSATLSGVAVPSPDGAGLVVVSASAPPPSESANIFTRKLQWSALTAYERCRAGDHDGDGLTGCADPDCWAVCAPLCPPGVSCDPGAARCGDSVCSSLESPQSCPGDCGAPAAWCGDFVCSPDEDCPGDCDW